MSAAQAAWGISASAFLMSFAVQMPAIMQHKPRSVDASYDNIAQEAHCALQNTVAASNKQGRRARSALDMRCIIPERRQDGCQGRCSRCAQEGQTVPEGIPRLCTGLFPSGPGCSPRCADRVLTGAGTGEEPLPARRICVSQEVDAETVHGAAAVSVLLSLERLDIQH